MNRRVNTSRNMKFRTVMVNEGTREIFEISLEKVGILFPYSGLKKNIVFRFPLFLTSMMRLTCNMLVLNIFSFI